MHEVLHAPRPKGHSNINPAGDLHADLHTHPRNDMGSMLDRCKHVLK